MTNDVTGGGDGDTVRGVTTGGSVTAGENTGEGMGEASTEGVGEVQETGSGIESGSSDNWCSKVIRVKGLECRPVQEADLDGGLQG